jgi:hypothetical protein
MGREIESRQGIGQSGSELLVLNYWNKIVKRSPCRVHVSCLYPFKSRRLGFNLLHFVNTLVRLILIIIKQYRNLPINLSLLNAHKNVQGTAFSLYIL